MACKRCDSGEQKTFNSEIAIHHAARIGLALPTVLVFPKLLVCLQCGFTEFTVPENELQLLARPPVAEFRSAEAS
jgi:hypothetical protein